MPPPETRRLCQPGDLASAAGEGLRVPRRETGERIEDADVLQRIRALAIPPAWEEVWICADPLGHIQATGVDARGRKQYRYHDLWRERRDRQKFEDDARLRPLAARAARPGGARPPQAPDLPRAGARLRRAGCSTAASSGSARRTTPRRTRPTGSRRCGSATSRVNGDKVVFDYEAKGGKRRVQTIADPKGLAAGQDAARSGGEGATSCSPTATERSGATSARPRSTTTSRTRSARSTAPRTSAPGTRRCSPRSCSPPPRASAT